MVNRNLLQRLLCLAALPLMLAPAQAKKPSLAELREASYECQLAAIQAAGGTVDPNLPCVCNARVGLPENAACRAARTAKPKKQGKR